MLHNKNLKSMRKFILLPILFFSLFSLAQNSGVRVYRYSYTLKNNDQSVESGRMRDIIAVARTEDFLDISKGYVSSVGNSYLSDNTYFNKEIQRQRGIRNSSPSAMNQSVKYYKYLPGSSQSNWLVFQGKVKSAAANMYSYGGWSWQYFNDLEEYYVLNDNYLVFIDRYARYYYEQINPDTYFRPRNDYYYYSYSDRLSKSSRPSYIPNALYMRVLDDKIQVNQYGKSSEPECVLELNKYNYTKGFRVWLYNHYLFCYFYQGNLVITDQSGELHCIYEKKSMPSQSTSTSGSSSSYNSGSNTQYQQNINDLNKELEGQLKDIDAREKARLTQIYQKQYSDKENYLQSLYNQYHSYGPNDVTAKAYASNYYHSAQRELRSIREEAQRKGISIPQSSWEYRSL